MFSLLSTFLLFGYVLSSPLGDYESTLKKNGLNVEDIHKLLKDQSKEVEQEFGSEETKKELAKLRSNYTPPSTQFKRVLKTTELSKDLFEGDVMLTPAQWKVALEKDPKNPMKRRQAFNEAVLLWQPIGAPVIPYKFGTGVSQQLQNLILEAQKFWEERTCIKFEPAKDGEEAFVEYTSEPTGCFSQVGRTGEKQVLNLQENGCDLVAIIAHELSHTFGTLHVQSRSDRDNYVIIDIDNIEDEQEHNYMQCPSEWPVSNYGIAYEFGSLMHYDEIGLAKNKSLPTIWAKEEYKLHQKGMTGSEATFNDIKLLNTMYKCTDKCTNKITCENNGVQDANDCNKCFCPPGWAGVNCEKRPTNIPALQVTSERRMRFDVGDPNKNTYKKQLYLIQAPEGKRLEAVVKRVGENGGYDCVIAGLEMFTKEDTSMAGYRVCNVDGILEPIVSEGNSILLSIYSDLGLKFFVDIAFRVV